MKILYIAPEHVSGGFNLFVRGHALHGNEARFVTFYKNEYGFQEDLCFDLIGMPVRPWVKTMKKWAKYGDQGSIDLSGTLPLRNHSSYFENLLFRFRDLVNAPRIENTISKYLLDEFDIFHFEQGADPYRDGRWVKKLSKQGKGIVCFYHGTDVRNRGIFEEVHKASQLNLTSEIDLLPKIPGMHYLYLPIDTELIQPRHRAPDGRIRIAHAARNRKYKGSDKIEAVVRRLADRYPIDWVMIENRPHHEALALKAASDIFIDQITDLGGWGYGASSVESLALGIPTITRINREVNDFLGAHPFISADAESIDFALIQLIEDENYRRELGAVGRQWVTERHGLDSVMKVLYSYYQQAGII